MSWWNSWTPWSSSGSGNVAPSLASPSLQIQVHTAGLPVALSKWAPGTGFATGKLDLGDLQVAQVTSFAQVWNSGSGTSGTSFYNAVNIPDGYHSFGCYAQVNSLPEHGWVLTVKGSFDGESPPLAKPKDYTLLWASADWAEAEQNILAYFWAPVVPAGYKALGFVVTNDPEKPTGDDQGIVLVREDLTDVLVIDSLLWNTSQLSGVPPFSTWKTEPFEISISALGLPVNTAYCTPSLIAESPLSIACLKNLNRNLDVMPTLEQLKQLMSSYGPRLYFHSQEAYLPTTPQWFFNRGALLYDASHPKSPVRIAAGGSNLPVGGSNDFKFWLDLPADGTGETVKKGDISAAKVLVHVKPMLGGAFTDFCCWIYHCFNGPSTARVGLLKSLSLGKIGEHVGDWEHFVIRVDNFSGELRRVYMAAHSGGTWFRLDELDFVDQNRAVVYSAKNTHALYPTVGEHLQGDTKKEVGIKNETEKSSVLLETNVDYEFINVDYLGEKGESGYPEQPPWVEYLRQWGPSVTYDSRSELEKILRYLPAVVRNSVINLIDKLPDELGGEEGPTGPKEKGSWFGDEKT